MKSIKPYLALLVLVLLAIAYVAARPLAGHDERFAPYALPLQETQRLFDFGVVDANGDDRLDLYTSNHHFRQALLIADGKGGYRDVLSGWGLDQSREFPLAELSYDVPQPDQPGIYVYWRGTNLVIRTHKGQELGTWQGSLHTYDPVTIVSRNKGQIGKRESKSGKVTETTLEFTSQSDGQMVFQPGGQGLPIQFTFSGAVTPEQIHVGLGKVSPSSTRFTLAMQDRHAHAWADFNGDGVPDVFINRGALSGTLRAHTAEVQKEIRDELFLSRGPGRFVESASAMGIDKNGCSGRHAKWVDYNADGLLDLFVNCYDREHVAGDFPKQLYRQGPGQMLSSVAEEAGLALPREQMGNLAWLDADGDGDVDLIASQDQGLFLYRNRSGVFSQETLARRAAAHSPKIGQDTGNKWTYDGKLTLADWDADGDLDVFLGSKTGNRLLRNQGGRFDAVDPASLGLPKRSGTGEWVDFDNDGRPDLHLFPQGLYRQLPDGRFQSTDLFVYSPDEYRAAIINWLDLDNDGRRDVVMALDRDPDFKHWWEFFKKTSQKGQWAVQAYRNVGAANHWIQVKLTGGAGNRPAIGARVTVVTRDGRQTQEVGSSEGAFFSQGHYRLYFGLGHHATVDRLEVRWSDGAQQRFQHLQADRLIAIERQSDPQHANPGKPEARR